MSEGPRFKFGENWQNFVVSIDESQLRNARAALIDLLGTESLENESFLDAGCGSGINSLAAQNLGARRIHSFDYDDNSVKATQALSSRSLADIEWSIEQGSLTDHHYLTGLGKFDTVYTWGVIHHTGAMWQVAESLPDLVNPGGRLIVAIYNDQGIISKIWRAIKRIYVESPSVVQTVMAAGYFAPTYLAANLKSLILKRRLRRTRPRGMSAWHDAIDWVGGYPFEVASREQVVEFYEQRGFTTEKVVSVGSKLGCNQFVFRSPLT